MRGVKRVLLVLALALGVGTAARAQDLAEAMALYDQGVMLKAAELARGFGTADGHALAAQATLVAAVYLVPGGPDRSLLRQAADDARAALALDPDHLEAHLRLAVALGYIGEGDPINAHLDGTAHEGKALLDRALALAPDSAWTHGLLGVWHLRVVRHAGPMLAEQLYGASLEQGRAQCAEAASLAPDVLAVRFGCAIALLEADPGRYTEEAAETLDTVAKLPADDAATQLIRADARRRLDLLKSGAAEVLGDGPRD
jgi:tetratricopeptide (TPR) repeat protein